MRKVKKAVSVKKTNSIEKSILSLVDSIQKMVDSLMKEIKTIRAEAVKQKKDKKEKAKK